jgi:excisionase family DNA binding protein
MSRAQSAQGGPKKAAHPKVEVPLSERVAVSPAEAAGLLGISRAQVFILISNGTLPSRKVGRLRLIRLDDVRALVTDQGASAQQVAA